MVGAELEVDCGLPTSQESTASTTPQKTGTMPRTKPQPKAPKKKSGHPKKGQEKWTVEAQAIVLATLAIGGSFRQAGTLVGVDQVTIFHHMNRDPSYKEQVMRHRVIGVEFRKMIIEDCIMGAVEKIESDPRYSILAIYVTKARLNWSDLPPEATNGINGIREVFAEIVKRKQAKLSQEGNLAKTEKVLTREGYITPDENGKPTIDVRAYTPSNNEAGKS